MPITHSDLQDFHEFATGRLNNGGAELSVEEMAFEWQTLRESDEVHAAIRQGLADIEAVRYQTAEEFNEEIRRKYGFKEK